MEAFIDLAKRHKLLPLVAEYILTRSDGSGIASNIHECLYAARARAQRRKQCFVVEASSLQQGLHAAGIRALARKGIVFDDLLYFGLGRRSLGDIDMYVHPGQAAETAKFLQGVGYAYGSISSCGERIELWSRRQLLRYYLYPDHLPKLVRTHDAEHVSCIRVDIALDFAWHGAPITEARHQLLEQELRTPQLAPNGLYTLSDTAHFIDCALHLYREACFETYIVAGSDIQLRKFMDLALLWRRIPPTQHASLSQTLHNYDLAGLVAWAAFHLDALFGFDVVHSLDLKSALERFPPNSWITAQGTAATWRGSMYERLFASDPKRLFDTLSAS
jgi:hypothetical protein